ADAAVSAGHTGAAMGAALLRLGRIPGVDRPAIAAVLSTVASHPVVLLDVGANVDCRPHHLLQFAIMGTVYARQVLEIHTPQIGLEGVCGIAHGSSKARAIRNAVRVAVEAVRHGFVDEIRAQMPRWSEAALNAGAPASTVLNPAPDPSANRP